ncbi:MAG: hypothetical protein ABI401_06240 [Candidatus Dormibacter sp.]
MKLNRMIALPLAGAAALAIGIAAVEAAPSPSASGSTNYAQVFVNKLAGILHLTPAQTQDALKQAQLQTVDQMRKDGKITQAQADAMKARINAGNGLGAVRSFPGGRLGADRTVLRDVMTAELNAAAGALHLSASDLQAQLKAGKTLADLEAAGKVSDTTVKAAMKAAARGVLDKAVKAGTMTQAQADAILARSDRGFGFRRGVPGPAKTPAGFFKSA